MRRMSGFNLWPALVLTGVWLAGSSLICDAQPREPEPGPKPLTALARSPLVTLDAAAVRTGVTLRLRHSADQTPLRTADLTVSVEGRNEPATAHEDGVWSVPLARPVAAGDRLEVVVAHDGIREILSGRFAAPSAPGPASPPGANPAGANPPGANPPGSSPAGRAESFWHAHKQTAWWILNVAIVLIAAMAISRRMS